MGFHVEDGINMKRRRLKQRLCNKAFLLEFTVLVLTVIFIVLLVENFWDTPTSPKGRFQNGGVGSLRDKLQHLDMVGLSPNEECKVPRLDPGSKPPANVACRRIKPIKDSCKVANELFFSKPTETCPTKDAYDICEIKNTRGKTHVKCSDSVCKRSITLGVIDPSQGILVWKKIQDIGELEAQVQSLIQQPLEKPNYGFCFVKCFLDEEAEEEEVVVEEKVDEEARNLFGGMLAEMEQLEKESDVYYVYQDSYADVQYGNQAKQLILLPPQIDRSKSANSKGDLINVNVILLDSVSHSHFLRSMSATVQELQRIKREKSAHVFSYNLVQSLKARTYENVQALFSGEIYNPDKPFGRHDMPPIPIHAEVLLKKFKRGGYETTWTEDLCWTWEWGIVKNLVVHTPKEKTHVRWKNLQEAFKTVGIDRFDMTLSSCEILKANDHKDPFHGPDAVCYNGKYQQHYILSYLAGLQEQLNKAGKPFFHYNEINVAHDDYGRRIQTLDEDLAQYFKFLSTQDNTITVLFADHGNTYGSFFHRSDEARLEVYHPTLMMLASKNVAEILGEKRMQALTDNQDRLVSILDLHYTLNALAPGGNTLVKPEHAQYDFNPEGLLGPIDINRTCNSIPMIMPNLCICEAFDFSVANDTRQALVAEFALGEINNAIQEQFRTAHPDAETGFGSCQRLVGTWFANVQENFNKNTLTTKLDLHVPAGENASQDEDVFFVIVQTSLTFTTANDMKLVSYERISSYSQYGKCADEGVNVKLCVCSLTQPIIRLDHTHVPTWHLGYPKVFGIESTTQNVEKCLYVFERRTKAGIILEASLECPKIYFDLEVGVKSAVNVHSSKQLPVRTRVNPGEMIFLMVFMQKRPNVEWNVEYSIKYEQMV